MSTVRVMTQVFNVTVKSPTEFAVTVVETVAFNVVVNAIISTGGGGVVTSVFGRTGGVTAQVGDYDTDKVTEATNLYFTEARANAASDVVSNTAHRNTVSGNPHSLDTDDVPEGAVNFYYSEARVSANADVAANTAARHAEDHAARHVNGSDDIRDATSTLKGLATAAQILDLTLNSTHRGLTTGNPHAVTISQAGAADPATDITGAEAETLTDSSNADALHKHEDFDHIDLENALASPPARQEGRFFWNKTTKMVVVYPPGSEVEHSLGEEMLYWVYNDTVSDIPDGTVVGTTGHTASIPNVAPVTAAQPSGAVAVTTELIEAGTYGMVTVTGAVHNLDTSLWPVNTPLYLDPTTPGSLTATAPDSPNYEIFVGIVLVQDAVDGIVYVHSENHGNQQGVSRFFNGSSLLQATTTVSSNGTIVSLEYDTISGDPQYFMFGQALTEFSVPASVNLTAGTDQAPVENWVYIPASTGVLTVSTSGFPASGEYAPIATLIVQSAATVLVAGQTYKHHRWQDHLASTDNNGHLSHLNSWIRAQHATWLTGGAPSVSIVSVSDPDDVYFDATAGTAHQLHVNTFAANTMSTGDHVHVVNDSVTPFLSVDNLNTILADATGATLSGRYYSLVFLEVVNSDGTVTVLCNLPGGSYNGGDAAVADADGFSDYTLPNEYRGTGILSARVTLRHQAIAGGTWTLVQLDDLRGSLIGTIGGGGGSGAVSSFADSNFEVYNATDPTKVVNFDVSGVATGTTRTLGVPDADGTIELTSHSHTTTDVAEGTNLYYTEARVSANTDVAANTTHRGQSNPHSGSAASGANSDITSLTGLTTPLDEIYGGTGLTSLTAGDILYASATNVLAKLAKGIKHQVLQMNAAATALEWITDERPWGITILSPQGAENPTLIYTPFAVTITEVRGVVLGSSTPSVAIQGKYGSDRSAGGTSLTSLGAINSTTTGSTLTITSADVPAGNWIWFNVSTPSGTVDQVHWTVKWKRNG